MVQPIDAIRYLKQCLYASIHFQYPPTRLHEQFEHALQNGIQIGIHDAPHLRYIKNMLAPDPATEFVPHVERVLDANYWTNAKQKH